MANTNLKNYHIKNLIPDCLEYLKTAQSKNRNGFSTGYKSIDRFVSKFQKSYLILLAGYFNTGMTLARNIARNVAVDSNTPVAIFCVETTKEHLVNYMIASEARIDSVLYRNNKLNDRDWIDIDKAAGTLSNAPLFIIESHGDTIKEIIIKMRKMTEENIVKIIIIESFQFIRKMHPSKSIEYEVNQIARLLKEFTEEAKIPVVLVSNWDEPNESLIEKVPNIGDLGEFGVLHKYSDTILLTHWDPPIYRKDDDKGRNNVDILCVKNRHAPLGTAHLIFRSFPYCRVENPG